MGAVAGDRLSLDSGTGAQLVATVTAAAVVGQITLAGHTVEFTAAPAQGIGGLYVTDAKADGSLVATSARGNRIAVPAPTADAATVSATLTLTDGSARRLNFRVVPGANAEAEDRNYDQFRSVLLDSGQSRGNRTLTANRIPTAGKPWIDPDPLP